jgi:hypothetical protein
MPKEAEPTVFICYSHLDAKFKDELLSHLRVIEREGAFRIWDDSRLSAGEDWRSSIEREIANARVAILLVSQHMLTSAFVRNEEIPRLLERRQSEGLLVIPVIARDCPWKRVPWLANMQARILGGSSRSRDWMYTRITNEVADLLEPGSIRHESKQNDASASDEVCAGHWVKISEGAPSRLVRLLKDGSLVEWNLFNTGESWLGRWQKDGNVLKIDVEGWDNTVFSLVVNLDPNGKTDLWPIVEGTERNSATRARHKFRVLHLPEMTEGPEIQ